MTISKINPSTLRITDMRFADIDGAPKRCTLVKVYTNQGLVGYGEVRDASSRTYAEILKSRILGENPCNVEKIFRRIKQFGGDSLVSLNPRYAPIPLSAFGSFSCRGKVLGVLKQKS